MTAKTNGAEFKRFYADISIWPEDAYHDGELVLVDGVEWDHPDGYGVIPDSAKVQIEDGGVYFPDGKDCSFEGYFKAWRKRQTVAVVMVECDKFKLDDVEAAVRAAGGKVL